MATPKAPTNTFRHEASGLLLRFLLPAFQVLDPETGTRELVEAKELLKKENDEDLQAFLDDLIIGLNDKPSKPQRRVVKPTKKGGKPLEVFHYGLVEIIPETAAQKAAYKAAKEKAAAEASAADNKEPEPSGDEE